MVDTLMVAAIVALAAGSGWLFADAITRSRRSWRDLVAAVEAYKAEAADWKASNDASKR